jgi:hypothetical protein
MNTYTICDALYDDVACYAVRHVATECTAIFDHDETVLNAVMEKIGQKWRFSVNLRWSVPYFRFVKDGKSKSLQHLLYALYNNMEGENVKGKKIALLDRSALAKGLCDIRSCNLYDAGESIAINNEREIFIVENPQIEGDKYIALLMRKREDENIEFVQYDNLLYTLLSSAKFCSVTWNKKRRRTCVTVHSKSEITVSLSRFLFIYYTHFVQYAKERDPITQFVYAFRHLNESNYTDMDVGHVNAYKWINCPENLMLMDKKTNIAMHDYIRYFSHGYCVHAVVNRNGEILVEFTMDNPRSNGEVITRYFKCATPELYCSFQKTLLGKCDLTKKLQTLTVACGHGARTVLTPAGVIQWLGAKAKSQELVFWEWVAHKNKLLSMDDNEFITWQEPPTNLEHVIGTCLGVADNAGVRVTVMPISNSL